jgi:hypothetical protein
MQNVTRLFTLSLVVSGCGAGFVDTHSPATDGTDLAVLDARDLAGAIVGDLAGTHSGADLATAADLATPTGPQTVAGGSFVKGQQNGGDTGSGSASLVRNADGSETVLFGADFQCTKIPAGEVVLTSRASIGTGALQPGDLDLGPLTSSSGAQQYALPGADGGRRNLFVYCLTYGIDVAVARLQ